MSDEKPQEDPSMEDILASIRRIITDDESTEASAADQSAEDTADAAIADDADAGEQEDILELTQMPQTN